MVQKLNDLILLRLNILTSICVQLCLPWDYCSVSVLRLKVLDVSSSTIVLVNRLLLIDAVLCVYFFFTVKLRLLLRFVHIETLWNVSKLGSVLGLLKTLVKWLGSGVIRCWLKTFLQVCIIVFVLGTHPLMKILFSHRIVVIEHIWAIDVACPKILLIVQELVMNLRFHVHAICPKYFFVHLLLFLVPSDLNIWQYHHVFWPSDRGHVVYGFSLFLGNLLIKGDLLILLVFRTHRIKRWSIIIWEAMTLRITHSWASVELGYLHSSEESILGLAITGHIKLLVKSCVQVLHTV